MNDPFDEIEALALGAAPPSRAVLKKTAPKKSPLAKPVPQASNETKQAEPAEEITPLVKLFQERKIRIRGTIDRLRICGADVGAHIGDKNYSRIIANYVDKYLEVIPVIVSGRKYQMLYLTEAGLYKYLLQSKREEAEEFQDFVFELLTAERKRTVDSVQLALKIAQTELEEKCRENICLQREKASMGRKQTELYTAVNAAREENTKLKKADGARLKQKHAAADAEELRLLGRGGEQVKGWNC
jgi:prophage antirepressor-like protein